jgi:hypothetical protein
MGLVNDLGSVYIHAQVVDVRYEMEPPESDLVVQTAHYGEGIFVGT